MQAPVDTAPDLPANARIFRALADPNRLAILKALSSGEPVCVCDFTSQLPLEQPTVSHHLKILREAGLLAGQRRGTWMYYSLAPDAKLHILAALSPIFEP